MQAIIDIFEAVRDFLEMGGDVLAVIAIVLCLMWVLIFERLAYFRGGHREMVQQALAKWAARTERKSWQAHQIRAALISKTRMAANRFLPMIKTLVALCPLLGLLGTVTGMISVFDVLAVSGTGNARSMAAGVSHATIPTMAGMVAALSGVFANVWLARFSKREIELLEDHLTLDP